MFGSYLGINKDKKGAAGGSKYARTQQKVPHDHGTARHGGQADPCTVCRPAQTPNARSA